MDQVGVAHAVRAEYAERVDRLAARILRRAQIDRGIRARHLQRHQRVFGALLEADIAHEHGHAEDVDLVALGGEDECGGIVRAGVRVDDIPVVELVSAVRGGVEVDVIPGAVIPAAILPGRSRAARGLLGSHGDVASRPSGGGEQHEDGECQGKKKAHEAFHGHPSFEECGSIQTVQDAHVWRHLRTVRCTQILLYAG